MGARNYTGSLPFHAVQEIFEAFEHARRDKARLTGVCVWISQVATNGANEGVVGLGGREAEAAKDAKEARSLQSSDVPSILFEETPQTSAIVYPLLRG